MSFALGFKEVRIVKRNGRLLADARQQEKVILIERSPICLIHKLYDAENLILLA